MRNVLLWVVALFVTLGAARWQERTGPTYPVRGAVQVGSRTVALELLRSWSTGDQPVTVTVGDGVVGRVRWRRHKTNDEWTVVPMQRQSGTLRASLPHQPPAGKLEYQVELLELAPRVELAGQAGTTARTVFPQRAAVTRFKGEVSPWVLVPHIFAMFISLLFTTRAGLEGIVNGQKGRRYMLMAIACMVLGGFILGPLVQKAAFGAYWTGIPWGWDLTDNKTLAMALALVFAAWRLRGGRRARWSLVAAALVTLGVFVIPHSVWGSEIKWS